MNDNAEVLVAIDAFGIGVNNADIRFVYHFTISDHQQRRWKNPFVVAHAEGVVQ